MPSGVQADHAHQDRRVIDAAFGRKILGVGQGAQRQQRRKYRQPEHQVARKPKLIALPSEPVLGRLHQRAHHHVSVRNPIQAKDPSAARGEQENLNHHVKDARAGHSEGNEVQVHEQRPEQRPSRERTEREAEPDHDLPDQNDPGEHWCSRQEHIRDQPGIGRKDNVIAVELRIEHCHERAAIEPGRIEGFFGGGPQPTEGDEQPQRQQVRPVFAGFARDPVQQ